MSPGDPRRMVLFASSFRSAGVRGGQESPNISHVTLDGVRTLCGRRVEDAATVEDYDEIGPCCLRCLARWERAR